MIKNLILICQIFAINIFSTCSVNDTQLLECVLNVYLDEFDRRIGDEIFISDMKGWTDTSSILRILTIKSSGLEPGKIFTSEYKGMKIFFEFGTIQGDKINLQFSDTNFSMPDNINWTIKEIQETKDNENKVVTPEEFDEVQIVYNTLKDCIEDTNMMGRIKFKEKIQSKCGFCN